MWILLFLLPQIAATVWAMYNIKGIKAMQRKVLLIGIVALVLTYFAVQYATTTTGRYPFYGAKMLHDLSGTQLIPLIHLFYCYSLGIEHELRFFRIMMSLNVLMIPELLVFLSQPAEAPLIDAHFNYLHFNIGHGHELTLQIYAAIIFTQSLIEMHRILMLRRIFIVRELYLKREGKIVVWASLAVCVWILVSLIPPLEMLELYHGTEVLTASYSAIATGLIYLTVTHLSNDIIVDGDNRPVSITADADEVLANAIRTAITRDKVYLKSTLRIEDFAESLSSNRTYVARVCRLRFRMTFTELMNHHRVEHAKRMMADTPRKRIDEVAADSGFSSSSFFARVFKAHEGITPTQWRQNNIGMA